MARTKRPRTHVGPEEEEGADCAARDALIADYEAVAARRPGSSSFVAAIMLDFKWGYRDRRMTTWRKADLDEFLLSYCPRKVVLPETEILGVVPAVKDFLAFLAERGLLVGDPLEALADRADELLPEFAAAMVDPSHFGLGKGIFAQMVAEGVDLEKPEAIQRWIDAYNARPVEERAILESEPEREPARLVLPAVELPSPSELVEAARGSTSVAQLAAFTRYVGAGRPLTRGGNLTLADGKALVELLGTGDLVDPVIGGRQFRTPSTIELVGLSLVFRWAKAARFVKVRGGRVSATERGRRLGQDPLEDWRASFEALFRCDPLGIRAGRGGSFWSEILALVLEELPLLLYAAGSIEMRELREGVWEGVEGTFRLDDFTPHQAELRELILDAFDRDVLAPLTDLGAIVVEGGRVSLSGLGRWAMNESLRRQGAVAPVVGEFALASADELLRSCAGLDTEDAERELRIWIERHPWTAAGELAAAALWNPSLGPLAFHGFDLIGPAAEAAVRTLLDAPKLATHARLWLVQQGLEDPASVTPELLFDALADYLLDFAAKAGPLRMVAEVMALGPDESGQLRIVEQLGAVADPRAGELLAMIGRYHPSAAVAERARRLAGRRQRKVRSGGKVRGAGEKRGLGKSPRVH